MTLTQRLTLPLTVLLLLLAPLTGAFAADATCEGCGQTHDNPVHGGPITLTDWQTNETHTYTSLKCAIDAIRTEYMWSRARWTGPTGTEFTVTRAEDRWDASPADAVAFTVPGDECQSVVPLASDDALGPWLDRHGNPAHSDPVPLAQFAQADPVAPGVDGFSDVPADHWASEAVEVSADAGIVGGDPDGKFHGERDVTRYEMATILRRLLQRLSAGGDGSGDTAVVSAIRTELAQTGASESDVSEIVQIAADPDVPTPAAVPSGAPQWPDVPADHWAADAVDFATATGFMNGYPDGNFRGDQALSRYEIAVILRRLITRLGAQPQPVVAEGASQSGQSFGQPAAPQGPAAGEVREPASPRERFVQRLRAAGFSQDEAARAYAALQSESAETDGQSPQAQGQSRQTSRGQAAPNQPVAPDQPVAARAGQPDATRPRTTTPGVLGQSGLLQTPDGDTLGEGQASVSTSVLDDGDVRTFGVSTGIGDDTEVTATMTSGDVDDAVLLNAKHQVHSSDSGRTRAAVGVLDATDEIDTSVYGVVSRDTDSRTTVSAGLGGGDLLDGLFLSGERQIDDRTSALLEWTDIGDEDDLNAGLSHRLSTDLNLKAGVVDGGFAGSLSLNREF